MNCRFSTLAVVLALGVAGRAHADWPANRHDAARTATAGGVSRIAVPDIAWSHYLGGVLGAEQILSYDVGGDGTREFVFVLSGAVAAKRATDALVWRTPLLDVFRIDAIVDLDGDGQDEVVCSAGRQVHVLDATTGALRWSLPVGNIGSMGSVRIADFDRDGKPDVYVSDHACGAAGSLGDVAQVWSFAPGSDAPTRLFTLETGRRDYRCGDRDLVIDVDGDGQLEVVAQGTARFYVYSGVTGALRSASDSLGSIPYGKAFVQPVNVDADAAPELLCYTDTSYAPPTNSRRVFLLDWDDTTQKLVRRWQRSVADLTADRHAFGVGGATDLGHDGAPDVVTSFFDGQTQSWSTVVLDAATGDERATVPEGPFRGLLDLDGDGSDEVVVGDRSSGVAVYGWVSGGLAIRFRVSRFEPLTRRVRDATAPNDDTDELLGFDLDRSGTPALLGLSYGVDGATPEALVALRGGVGAQPIEAARLSLAADVAVVAVLASEGVTRSYPQLSIVRNDGQVWVLDEALAPTQVADPPSELPTRGLRVGGYYSGVSGVGRAPIAADLDGDGAAEVVLPDSRQVLLGLAARAAGKTKGPEVLWQLSGGRSPLIVDLNADARPEVVHWTTGEAAALRAVRGVDGLRLWQRTIGSSGLTPVNDLMAGDFDGDGDFDVAYALLSSTGGTVNVNVAEGRTGARLWPAEFVTVVQGTGLGIGSVRARATGGADLLLAPRDQLQWIAGASGVASETVLADGADYGIIANLDEDTDAEIVTSGGRGMKSFDGDLSLRWAHPGTLHSRVNGAVVDCGAAGARFVGGHFGGPRVSAWSAASGQIESDVALVAGTVQPWADTLTGGRVGNASATIDLDGRSAPAVLIPSTDGFLYALDACSFDLLWSFDFGFPVGEAIFADTDGDGADEILVTVANGFLYALDGQVFAAPAYAYENDGLSLAASEVEDVDELVVGAPLSVNWAEVPHAQRYEYAVLADDGAFVTQPDFLDAGATTSARIEGLPLAVGGRYRVAVRAVGLEGTSREALSDGVVVVEASCRFCGPCTECVANTCVGTCGGEVDAGVLPLLDGGSAPVDPAACGGACGVGTRCTEGVCVGIEVPLQPPPVQVNVEAAQGGCCSVAGTRARRTPVAAALLLFALFSARRARRR